MRGRIRDWPREKKRLTIQRVQLYLLNMLKTLGQKIKDLRLQVGLSLKDLGEKIGGKSAAFLSDIELGNRFPSDEVLEHIAGALGTTLADLRQYDQRPPTKEMQELISLDANYGMAFRTLVKRVKNGQISPSDVLKRFPEDEKK